MKADNYIEIDSTTRLYWGELKKGHRVYFIERDGNEVVVWDTEKVNIHILLTSVLTELSFRELDKSRKSHTVLEVIKNLAARVTGKGDR
jgi:hypothetical protein